MKYFVTGASGFIGSRICESLAARGDKVTAFCRDPGKLVLQNDLISVRQGDICKPKTLDAMDGADFCFHLASLAAQWARQSESFYRVNVDGTQNVLFAAEKFGLKKVVYTSTAGIYGPSSRDKLLNERSEGNFDLKSDYEKSKKQAEQVVKEFSAETGLPCCVVNPTRVYGPGNLSESNALTKIIRRYASGRVQWVPGDGQYIGNYVFVDDVVDGHLRAMGKGRVGENYILGGSNVSLDELFDLFAKVTCNQRVRVRLPLPLIKMFASMQDFLAAKAGLRPLVTCKSVSKYASNNAFSIEYAKAKLGYDPIGLKEGVQRTVSWLSDLG